MEKPKLGAYNRGGETRIVSPHAPYTPNTNPMEEVKIEPSPPTPTKPPTSLANQPQRRGSYLSILLFYLNACYFLGIIPVRIVQSTNPEHEGYRMVFSKLQNSICGAIHGLFVSYALFKVRWLDPINELSKAKGTTGESTVIFVIVLAATEICYMLSLIYVFWQKSQVLTFVARNYPSDEFLPPRRGSKATRKPSNPELQKYHRIKTMLLRTNLGSVILFGIFTAIGIREFLAQYLEEKDPLAYVKDEAAPLFFFLGTKFHRLPTIFQNVLCLVFVVSDLLYNLMLNYGNLFFLILALISHDIGKHFVSRLQNKDLSVRQVIEAYDKTKRIIHQVNEEYGMLTLFFVLTSIPYYANLFPDFLHNDKMGLDERFAVGWNLCVMTLVLYLTTGMADKIKKFKEWLAKPCNSNQISPDELANLRDEVSHDMNIGLSANGFFVVSYASIGRILQMLVTYGLIAAETGFLPGNFTTSLGIDPKILENVKEVI